MDWKKFEEDLYKYGLISFQKIRKMRPENKFYSFAFFTSAEFGYIATTASSYEGLEEVASRYKSQSYCKDKNLDELQRELKWCPEDSPLHLECGETLTQLQPMMDKIHRQLCEIEVENNDWTKFDNFRNQVENTIAKAMRRIDREGIFGVENDRHSIVLNLLMGDQSNEEMINFARKVNPPKTLQILESELQ